MTQRRPKRFSATTWWTNDSRLRFYTDTDGPSGPNQALSERRAEAVRAFLIQQGIDGARLTAVGFGETSPILVDGVEDKAASRRIEFTIR